MAGLRRRAAGGPVLLGFDFPIGLPAIVAARQPGFADFPDWLAGLDEQAWDRFRAPADRLDEITASRPFFPRRAGGASHAALCRAHGVGAYRDLLRRCDRRTPTRGDACCMFWTLGPQQCGRAALTGWHEIIRPGLRRGDLAAWPFHGDLEDLVRPGRLVVAETYPAEVYRQLGLGRSFGKRTQAGRQRQASALRRAAGRHHCPPSLEDLIATGFGSMAAAENPFDAMVGLLGMLEVVDGRRAAGAPGDPAVRRSEGWMLGLVDAAP